MTSSTAYSYAQRALNDVPSRATISTDQERSLRKLSDAVENLARAVMELARKQD